jgi:hypothetical protein
MPFLELSCHEWIKPNERGRFTYNVPSKIQRLGYSFGLRKGIRGMGGISSSVSSLTGVRSLRAPPSHIVVKIIMTCLLYVLCDKDRLVHYCKSYSVSGGVALKYMSQGLPLF